jgi:hypothetical protein
MHKRIPALRLGVVFGIGIALIAATAAVVYAADTVFTPVNAAGTYDPKDTLVIYGDVALFADQTNPDVCTEKSRFKPGEGVGFRMTAIDPSTGDFATSAEMTVTVNYGGKTEAVPMRYRGDGNNAHPGMWTGKWVIPDDAPAGIVHYSVQAKTSDGKSGVWQPFDVQPSSLTIIS